MKLEVLCIESEIFGIAILGLGVGLSCNTDDTPGLVEASRAMNAIVSPATTCIPALVRAKCSERRKDVSLHYVASRF